MILLISTILRLDFETIPTVSFYSTIFQINQSSFILRSLESVKGMACVDLVDTIVNNHLSTFLLINSRKMVFSKKDIIK